MRTRRCISAAVIVAVMAPALAALPATAAAGPGAATHEHDAGVPHVHSPTAPDGVDAPQISPYRRDTSTGVTARASLQTGTAFVPVALVDFSDNPSRFAREDLHDMLFRKGYPHGAGSFADYYDDQSGGTFEITGATSPWTRMPRPYADYVGANHGMQTGATNDQTLAADAAARVDDEIDFCRADRNTDGYADTFVVLHAGPGASETGSGLWPVAWSLPSPVATKDKCADGRTMKIKSFIIVSERHADPALSAPGAPRGLTTIGTIVHEFGHVLGLPDLYDTTYQTPGGVGQWDVMGTGSWGFGARTPWRPTPLSAWSRLELGWATATNVDRDRHAVELASADAPRRGAFSGVYRLAPGGNASAGEYFLVERRTKVGYAAEFPREGILVWRVRSSGSPRVSLVQADGRDDLGRHGTSWAFADAGDLFPGSSDVRELDDEGSPSTLLSNGTRSNVTVAGITNGGGAASFFITPPPAEPPAPPGEVTAEPAGGGGIRIRWNPSPSDDVFEYRVYRRPPGGGTVKVAAVPASTSSFTDPTSGKEGTTYVVRAYNRLESGDSNPAGVTATATPVAEGFAPKSVAILTGKKVRGNASSLSHADGRALEIASRAAGGRHRLSYRITVGVSGAPEKLLLTGVVDRNLKGRVALKTAAGTWEDVGTLAASPSTPFSLAVAGGHFISAGSVEIRITATKARSFSHKLNALAVVLP